MADIDVTLGIDTSGATSALRSIENNVQNLTNKFASLRGILGGLALGNIVRDANQLAAAIGNVNRATGISTDTISGFAASVGRMGGNSGVAAGDVLELTAQLDSLRRGSVDVESDMLKLGLTIADMNKLAPDELFKRIVGGLQGIENNGTRSALAIKYLGKSFKDMDIRDISMGGGGPNASAIRASSDAQQSLNRNLDNFKTAIVNSLEGVNNGISQINITVRDFERTISGATVAVAAFGAAFIASFAGAKITSSVKGVVDQLDNLSSLSDKQEGNVKKFEKMYGGLFNSIQKQASKIQVDFDLTGPLDRQVKEIQGRLNDLRRAAATAGDKEEMKRLSGIQGQLTRLTQGANQARLANMEKERIELFKSIEAYNDYYNKVNSTIGITKVTDKLGDSMGKFNDKLRYGFPGMVAYFGTMFSFLGRMAGHIGVIVSFVSAFDLLLKALGQKGVWEYLEERLNAISSAADRAKQRADGLLQTQREIAATSLEAQEAAGARAAVAAQPFGRAARRLQEQRNLNEEKRKENVLRESANALALDDWSIAIQSNNFRSSLNEQLERFKFSLQSQNQQLTLQNDAVLKQLQLQKDNLRQTDDQKELSQRLLDIDIARTNAIADLQNQIKLLNLEETLGVEDPNRAGKIAALNEAIAQTNTRYRAQSGIVQKLLPEIQAFQIVEADRARNLEILNGRMERQVQISETLSNITRGIINQEREARREREDMGLRTVDRERMAIVRRNTDAMREAQRQLAESFGETDVVTPEMFAQYNRDMEQIQQRFRDLTNLQMENLVRSRTWSQGWADAFRDFVENATNSANIARDVFSTFTSSAERALDIFTTKGTAKFKRFVGSIIADMARLAVQLQFRQLIAGSDMMKPGGGLFSLFSGLGANSGSLAGGAVLGLPGYANGGLIPPGRLGLVGERGPEIISGPAQITPFDNIGMGGGTTNNYYTINAVDARSVAELFASNKMSLLGAVRSAERSLPGTRTR